MSIRRMIELGAYRRITTAIVVAMVVVVGFMLFFGMKTVERIRAVETHWTHYSRDAVAAANLLHDVSMEMGHGGFIHRFRGDLLRGDLDGLAALERDHAGVKTSLDALRRHVITPREHAALADIRAAFDRHSNAIARAREGLARGGDPVEIEAAINLEHTPDTAPFEVLETAFQGRLALVREETQKALDAASNMVWVLLVAVPVVVLLGVSLIAFLRRTAHDHTQLTEVRDELASLLRQAPDAILHVDDRGRVVRVNDQAVRLFGYPREEFLRLSVEDLIPHGVRSQHVAIREQAFDGMQDRPVGDGVELWAVTKDGREVPVDISLSFATSGGRRYATAIVRDITERKQTEEMLRSAHDQLERRVRERTAQLERRTDQLEAEVNERKRAQDQLIQSAKMATIGQMTAGITHELNQPLNIMRMGVEGALMRIDRGEADPEFLGEALHKVGDQIVRMSDIITHMRAYSRQDEAQARMPFDPARAVASGCELFAAQLQGDGIELDVDVPPRAATVLGHHNRLEQVILNLLSNARDAILMQRERIGADERGQEVREHMHDHARVHMQDHVRVHMHDDPANEVVTIHIEDTGGGVPKDVLPHIFAPFVTTKESGQGTGLGLSISFGIVEAMDGTIEVMNLTRGSRVEGARFTIRLPRADLSDLAAADMRRSGSYAGMAGGTGRPVPGSDIAKVMVVDDEVGAAHSLSDFLQEMGYLVYTAYNGEEAIRLYESDPVDAVISDLRMPVMAGDELAHELRRQNAHLPIFIMTGQDLEPTGRLAGATEIWRKPLSLSDVAARLQGHAGTG